MSPLNNPAMDHISYGAYLVVSIGTTIWLARVLSRSGEVFLTRCFGQQTELAISTNRLLIIGFYLVNIGFICLRLSTWPSQQIDLIPALGSRIGVSILVLGVMHFVNMLMIARFGQIVSNWLRMHGSRPAGNPPPPFQRPVPERLPCGRGHCQSQGPRSPVRHQLPYGGSFFHIEPIHSASALNHIGNYGSARSGFTLIRIWA